MSPLCFANGRGKAHLSRYERARVVGTMVLCSKSTIPISVNEAIAQIDKGHCTYLLSRRYVNGTHGMFRICAAGRLEEVVTDESGT